MWTRGRVCVGGGASSAGHEHDHLSGLLQTASSSYACDAETGGV